MSRAGQIFLYPPAISHSNFIERPSCSECETPTRLFGIEAERSGYELHTFVCPNCDHLETAVGTAA